MTNTDKVVEYVISNAGKLAPEKIRALAAMVQALGGEVLSEPNTLPIKNDNNLLEDSPPLDLNEIQQVEVEGIGKKDVRIYQ